MPQHVESHNANANNSCETKWCAASALPPLHNAWLTRQMSLSFCHELCMDSVLFLSVERSPGADAAECCDGVVKAGREGLDNTSCRTYSVQRHYCSFLYSNFTFLTLNVELTTHYGCIDRSSQYFQNSFLLTAEEF